MKKIKVRECVFLSTQKVQGLWPVKWQHRGKIGLSAQFSSTKAIINIISIVYLSYIPFHHSKDSCSHCQLSATFFLPLSNIAGTLWALSASMDILHTPSSGPSYGLDSSSVSGLNPLSVSSGNVQSSFFNGGDGVENQRPLLSADVGDAGASKGPLQFPSPAVKLGSNDIPDHALHRKQKRDVLKGNRSKHLVNLDRPYLVHPKYLEYRSRPRQDIGPDGKPVWDERTEAAFQNGKIRFLSGIVGSLISSSIGSYEANGKEKMFPTWETLWTQYAYF